MLRLRLNAVALQPALEVKAANQVARAVVANFLFVEVEQILRRRVGQLDLAFEIDRKNRLRHGDQQRAQGAVLPLRRHIGDGAHVGHAGRAANLRHQAAELVEFKRREVKVNTAERRDFNAA